MKFAKTWTLVFAISCALGSIVPSNAKDQFDYLEGKWTPTTGPQIGAPIWFHEAFGGWDAIFDWWGRTTIIRSNGYRGSHVKVEGNGGDRCFYYISIMDKRRMAWNLKFAESGNCPGSLVLERDPLP